MDLAFIAVYSFLLMYVPLYSLPFRFVILPMRCSYEMLLGDGAHASLTFHIS